MCMFSFSINVWLLWHPTTATQEEKINSVDNCMRHCFSTNLVLYLSYSFTNTQKTLDCEATNCCRVARGTRMFSKFTHGLCPLLFSLFFYSFTFLLSFRCYTEIQSHAGTINNGFFHLQHLTNEFKRIRSQHSNKIQTLLR